MADKKAPHYGVGVYKVRITAQLFGKSEKKETPYFGVFFAPIARVDTATAQEVAVGKSYERDCRLYITEGTKSFIGDQLRALGVTAKRLADLDPDNPNHQNLVGTEVMMYCSHNKDGYENWQPSQQDGSGVNSTKEKPASESGVSQELDALFGGDDILGGGDDDPANDVPDMDIPDAGTTVGDEDVPF